MIEPSCHSNLLNISYQSFWVAPVKIDVGKTILGGDTILLGGNGRAYKDGLYARQQSSSLLLLPAHWFLFSC